MRGLTLVTAFLFTTAGSFAQLYVSPNETSRDNFLYVNGNVIFVANNIDLVENRSANPPASIYLREGSQLLQGQDQRTSNSGKGKISIFQEGTSNAFDYNYWSSPVSAAGQDVFGISMLSSPTSETTSEPAIVTGSLNGTAKPLSISNQWIYTFSGQGYSNWNFVGSNTAVPAGLGFTMKGTNGQDLFMLEGRANNPGNSQRYDFRGRPNSGTFEVPVAAEEFTLVGNPYPSALDMSLFLLENSGSGDLKPRCYENITRRNAITGIAYFWDSTENGNSHYLDDYEGGYGAFSPVDPCTTGIYERPLLKKVSREHAPAKYGEHYERRFVPVAQGFMVQGAENEKLVFKNSQRIFRKEGANSDFKKTAGKQQALTSELVEIPKIRFLINVGHEYSRSLSLGFWPAATPGIDPGMDAAAYDVAPVDIGWLHGENAYVIDVRPFDVREEIPLFLNVEKEGLELNLAVTDFGTTQLNNIYLLDTETGTYASLAKQNFVFKLDPGDYSGRFKIAFTEKINALELPEELLVAEKEDLTFSIFQNNLLGELEIISNSASPMRSVGIFDLQGKRLYFRSNFDNPRSISINSRNWANGVYIVKVTDKNNKRISKKIAVQNNS